MQVDGHFEPIAVALAKSLQGLIAAGEKMSDAALLAPALTSIAISAKRQADAIEMIAANTPSLRDQLAMQALAGISGHIRGAKPTPRESTGHEADARWSYAQADAMLKARGD